MRCRWGSSRDCRADEKWEQVCGSVGQCSGKEGKLEDGGSGDLKCIAWRQRLRAIWRAGDERVVEKGN